VRARPFLDDPMQVADISGRNLSRHSNVYGRNSGVFDVRIDR
jgi:hypothetical protein